MRIKHLTLMSGPAGNFQIGQEREIDDAEGAALVTGGYAIEVKRRNPEAAIVKAPESAASAEEFAAKSLQKIAAAGTGRSRKGRQPAAAPAQQDEAARDANADAAPAPTSGESSADASNPE